MGEKNTRKRLRIVPEVLPDRGGTWVSTAPRRFVFSPVRICCARCTMLAGFRRCWIRSIAPSTTLASTLASLTPMIGGESKMTLS